MAAEEAKSKSTKHLVFLVAIVLFVSLFAAGYIVKDRRGERKIITNGDRAPEFRLPALNGQYVSLSDLRGKVVMVHFWATWCPPCVEELPTLAKLYENLMGKDFALLAVSEDEGGARAVASFLQQNGLNVPVLLDPDRATAGRYGTFKFPETYIVDREGIVRYKVVGPRDWQDPAALQFLQNMIAVR